MPKIRLEIVVDDEDAAAVVAGRSPTAARTGKIGDGKVWTVEVEDLVRIRTGERGSDAV